MAQQASGVEYYTLLAGPLMAAPPDSAARPHGREDDLFAGVPSSPAPARVPGDAAAGQSR